MTRSPVAHQHDRVGAVVLAAPVEQPQQSERAFDPCWAVACGKPLLAWSLAALARTTEVEALALIVAPERLAEAQALIDAEGWQTARVVASEGGLVSALRAGLGALPAASAWVVVHDATRPLVTPELVAAGIATARRTGVAGAAVAIEPIKETIKRVRDGVVVETLERSRLALLQTPQVYGRAALVAALPKAGSDTAATDATDVTDVTDVTDTATLALAGGIALATYAGSTENLKVRTPDDLAIAASLLQRRELDVSAPTSERGNERGSAEKDGAT